MHKQFEKLKYLIIDDMQTMRIAIKGMLMHFGAEDIDVAGNGGEAVSKMRQNRYDVVICDYNLGPGKNGQQVLEEARHDELIGYSTVFMMVTAENTADMVMGAVEYKPDDYLTKPINKDILKNRLTLIINKKDELQPVDTLLKAGEYGKALKVCNHLISAKPKYLSELLRMKGEIALTADALDIAEKVYDSILDKRRIPWAMTGKAKVLKRRKELDKAAALLKETIEEDPNHMEAYDELSSVQHEQGDSEAAQETLMQAVEISPIAIQRQMSLGKLAKENGDATSAEKAFRNAVRIGRDSIYKDPENYSNLVDALVEKGDTKEALKTLKGMCADYPDDKVIALKSTIVESDIYEGMGMERPAANTREKVIQQFARLKQQLPADMSLKVAEVHIKEEKTDQAAEILGDLARNHHEDNQMTETINKLVEEASLGSEISDRINNARQEIKDMNNQAVRLFREGNVPESMEIFRQLGDKAKNNRTIMLNSSRIHLEAAKRDIDKGESLEYARRFLKRIRDMRMENDKSKQMAREYRQLSGQDL